MRPLSRGTAIAVLTWTLGVVVLTQSVHFALSAGPSMHAALGWCEAGGALLFLPAFTRAAGSAILLLAFGIAAVAHVAQGQFDVGALLIYAAAVLVCAAEPRSVGGSHA